MVGFCLLLIGLTLSWGRHMEVRNAYLAPQARTLLEGYAAEAERALQSGGTAGVDLWLSGMRERESGFIGVIGPDLQPLGSLPLTDAEVMRLTNLRGLDRPISRHSATAPWMRVPFPDDSALGSLVIELPQRLIPDRWNLLFWRMVTNGLIPGLLTLLFCVGLYRMLIRPLHQLRDQANAWRAERLTARVASATTSRGDEFGELGRAFDDMAERLQSTVALQQQLLRDLSHELRTPLSRLQVASDSEQDPARLRERLGREVEGMQRLVEDALQLAWLDAERAPLACEPIEIAALWEMLCEDACFETAWPRTQLHCELDGDCWVQGHLNSLAQALENILRNAIRHSPGHGRIRLGGQRQGEHWLIWLEDEGGGVDEAELERIFAAFTRLDGSRPGDGGFGLGLSIARNAVQRQGGRLWAQNTGRGLRLNLRLLAVQTPELVQGYSDRL
ncbi:histidine kinase sensor domain-containing protein [Pseudomonas sp. zfem002]|uniref:histidine kinase sensor domain-containing protein n=1 Tax=Pseudomonas sp. zfem002 TaxID=3078197 RepID=UPI002927D07B|nr:histidine kinase sensor domain-containing protein [Pseudomonas sp. zfem002]MDU9390723.1 histidine kinase sensor domain-containing protein [Pseudomonas sp. zfem002]